VHEFVQNSVFSQTLARFVIFALGAPPFSDFPQIARIFTEQKFSAQDQYVLAFSHWAHHVLAIFSKL